MPRRSPVKSMDSGFKKTNRLLGFVISAPNSFHLINFKGLPDVPLNQLHNITFALRLTVAEPQPHGNRQTKLRRHDLRVGVCKTSLANEKTHKPGEVMHDIRVILLGLQACHLRILELLNGQHFPCTANLRIVENIADLIFPIFKIPFYSLFFFLRCSSIFLLILSASSFSRYHFIRYDSTSKNAVEIRIATYPI